MQSILAQSSTYFGTNGFPLRIGRSQPPKTGDLPRHPEDLTSRKHHHDFNELVIVYKGYGVQHLDGIDLPITVGDVFLLQGNQEHYFHSSQQLELINVMYDLETICIPEDALKKIPGYCAMFILEPTTRKLHRFASRLHLNSEKLLYVENIASEIERECEEKADGYEPLCCSKLVDLIIYLSRTYSSKNSNEAKSLLRVGKVIGALEKDYNKNWTLDELTHIAHMSKSNLLVIFKKATGHTPISYLTLVRIRRAIELMRHTKQSITEIAFAVGFNDSNYFTRQFRKSTGKSPRTYRALLH